MTITPDTPKENRWYSEGYRYGWRFAACEADYDEVAAVARAQKIPAGWDLFRAQILNRHIGEKTFEFAVFEAGFTRACMDFFEKI